MPGEETGRGGWHQRGIFREEAQHSWTEFTVRTLFAANLLIDWTVAGQRSFSGRGFCDAGASATGIYWS
jgi:hypothetical protein